MKYLYIFLLLIILINFSSSKELGMSPGIIDLEIRTGELVCKNFTILGDNTTFSGEIKWSETNSKEIEDYNLDLEDIKTYFPEKTKPGEKEICFETKEPGKYFGVLKYRLENNSYGIAIWVELSVEEKGESKINLLQGEIIDNLRKNINDSNILVPLLTIIFLLLMGILIFLIKSSYLLKTNKPK
jgi:hypothetical protein